MTTSASLRLTVAQPTVVDGDLEATVRHHVAAVERAPAAVVVFPELSLTGYRLDAAPVELTDRRLGPLIEACDSTGSVALVGAPTGDIGRPHLSMLAVDGGGVRVAYRKVNLGGDEVDRFEPGPAPAVIEIGGWRFGLAICRDTGVPGHAAQTAALGIDAYLAGVCEHRADAEVVEQRARCIATDHRVWVGVASFAGSTGHGYDPAAGRSGIWGPDGAAADRAGPEPDETATATAELGRPTTRRR